MVRWLLSNASNNPLTKVARRRERRHLKIDFSFFIEIFYEVLNKLEVNQKYLITIREQLEWKTSLRLRKLGQKFFSPNLIGAV